MAKGFSQVDIQRDMQTDVTRNPPWLQRSLLAVVTLLVVIGVASAIGRTIFVGDLAIRAEPLRQQVLLTLQIDDALAAERPEELKRLDGRFGAHPFATMLHILPGALFLLLAPFQFSARIRRRHIRLHRWSGRLLVLAAFLSTLPGLYFGFLMPYGGSGETIVIALVGGLFLTSIVTAVVAIRRGQIARHREWMIRAFALALGISTVRLVAGVLDLTMTTAGYSPRVLFVVALAAGWGITLAAAEIWIRHTRPHSASLIVPVSSPAG